MRRTRTVLVWVVFIGTAVLAGHAAAQDCFPAPEGLVSWWPGDGNADDINDGNAGTLLARIIRES